MFDIISIGEVLIDLTGNGLNEQNAYQFPAYPGGAPANMAVAASRLGARTAFIGKIGKDFFGKIIRSCLVQNGVSTEYLLTDDKDLTTLAVVSVDENGERDFRFYRDPSADVNLAAPDISEDFIKRGKILHFGSLSLTNPVSRRATEQAVHYAKQNHLLVSYDPNYRASLWPTEAEAVQRIASMLSLADVVKISDEELILLTSSGSLEERARKLAEAHAIRLLLITLGADGAGYFYDKHWGIVPTRKTAIADTNGAGDTFFGAFVAKLSQHDNLGELDIATLESFVSFANLAASITISRPGAIPAMPSLEEVENLIS